MNETGADKTFRVTVRNKLENTVIHTQSQKSRRRSGLLASFLTATLVGSIFGISQFASANVDANGNPIPEMSQGAADATSPVTVAAVVGPQYIPATLGGTVTLTLTFSNPSTLAAATIDQFQINIPTGITYNAGTSTINGGGTSDPSQVAGSGETYLTYSQDITVPVAPQAGQYGTSTLALNLNRSAGTSGVVTLGQMQGTSGVDVVGPTTASFNATAAPTVLAVAGEVTKNGSVTVTPNGTAGAGTTMDTTATLLQDPITTNYGTSATTYSFPATTPPTVAGVFTFNPVTEKIDFVPATDFVGETRVNYQMSDAFGQISENTVSVVVSAPPTAGDIVTSTALNVPIAVNPTDYATAAPNRSIVPASTCLKATAADPNCVTTLVIPGAGTYTFQVGPQNILFTPATDYTGTASAFYQVTDDLGGVGTGGISVTVADTTTASAITATTGENKVATLTPQATATPGQTIASTCLKAAVDTPPAGCSSTLSVTGGVFSYDSGTNKITFTPTASWSGLASGYYQVTDTNGAKASASMSVTVVAAPVAAAVSATTGAGKSTTLTPSATAASGYTIDATKTCLLETVDGTCGTTANVSAKGTFTYDSATGKVTFAPADSTVTGSVSVYYRVTDSLGTNSAVNSTSTMNVDIIGAPTVPSTPVTANTSQGVAVQITPTATASGSATIDGTLTCLKVSPTSTCTNPVSIPGQGTYSYSSTTGKVTFTPVSTYVSPTSPATPSTVYYQVTDNFGNTAVGQISVTVTASGGSGGGGGTGSTSLTTTVSANKAMFAMCTATVTSNCIGGTAYDPNSIQIYSSSGVWGTTAIPATTTVTGGGTTQYPVGSWTVNGADTASIVTFTQTASTIVLTNTTGTGTSYTIKPRSGSISSDGSGTSKVTPTLMPSAGAAANGTTYGGSVDAAAIPATSVNTSTITARLAKTGTTEYTEYTLTASYTINVSTPTTAPTTSSASPSASPSSSAGTTSGTGTNSVIPGTGGTTGTGGTGTTNPPGTGTGTTGVTPTGTDPYNTGSGTGNTSVVPTGALPKTGGEIVLPSIIGMVMLGAGLFFITMWSRRRKFSV